jgi:CheY-like chemotaxis protein
MPVMDGIELAHQAKSAFPALKILLMTGYAEQRERADDLAEKIVDVVSKPFALPDIRKAPTGCLRRSSQWPSQCSSALPSTKRQLSNQVVV